jgi:transposase
MPRLRQNDCDRPVDMVQAGMTHHAVADHFNVSRIIISRLMIRFRQTGRTNDRPVTGMPRVTSQRQDNFFLYNLRLIDLRNSMIIAVEHLVWKTSEFLVRLFAEDYMKLGVRWWDQSLNNVIDREHAVVGGLTSFLVMNPDFNFVLAMDVIACTAGVGNVLRTSVCTNPIILEAEVLWSGLEFVMMVALSSKLFNEHWMP